MANIQAATVTTTAGAGSNLVRAYFDRMLLERVKQQTRFYQFGTSKPLPLTEGASVTWNRKRALGLGFELSQGVPTSTGYTLSTTQVTRSIRQFGAHVPISDLIDLTAIADVGILATEELADQAARTIDRTIQLEIINHASAADDSGHYLFKTSAETTDKLNSPLTWKQVMEKFSLINGENLIMKVKATLNKAMCQLQRLSERTSFGMMR